MTVRRQESKAGLTHKSRKNEGHEGKRVSEIFCVSHKKFILPNYQLPITHYQFMNVVVSYDISEDKRRTKIHSILKSYGQWVQYSIFECQLTDTQYAKLRSRLNKLIKPETDSIRFYFLCACCFGKVERIGGEQPRDETIFFA